VLDADEPKTCRRERGICARVQDQGLSFVPGLRRQSAIVECIGDEPAQIRVHPSRLAEEDTSFLRHGRGTVERMFERGKAGSARMAALYRLGKLHLVANQNHVLGAHAHWLV
jgi:hypothetical protein